MKHRNPFRDLTKFEWTLWISSLVVVSASYLLAPDKDWLTLLTSLIGVTALIFVAKGYVIGQALCVVFALAYGVISFYFRYYGEMITYLGMSAPSAIAAMITWIRNPYRESAEVKVEILTKKKLAIAAALTVGVTVAFYFILGAMNTANLAVSTVSVTTSFAASALTVLRSPWYAVAYAANDVVLIVMWGMATAQDVSYLPMIFCFVMFLLNDLYGFFNWRRMRKRQFVENL